MSTRFHAMTIALMITMSVSAQEPRSAGTKTISVISHGLTFGKAPPSWTADLAKALRERGHQCIITDWAERSAVMERGCAEVAGRKLAETLIAVIHKSASPRNVHFIGFSRGTVVNSIAQMHMDLIAKRDLLLQSRLAKVWVTMLDPHPANGKVGFAAGSKMASKFTKQFEQSTIDPFPVLGKSTSAAFIYYQESQATAGPFSVNPYGWKDAAKASPLVRTRTDLTKARFNGRPITHTDVPRWYIHKLSIQESHSAPQLLAFK